MSNAAIAKREPAEVGESRQFDAICQMMTQRTPDNEIRTRPGRGGKPLKYTDGAYVIRTLNEAFVWDWDFVTDNEELLMYNGEPFEVKVRGTLTVRLNGQTVTKTQFGCQPIEMLSNGSKPVSIGDAYKGAATDAMKKCASLLGIALDLYDSDSDVNTGKKPQPPPAPARPVKLEGAQPTTPDGLPEVKSKAAAFVIKLAKEKGWNEAALAQAIEAKFGTVVVPGHLRDYLEFAQDGKLRELYRAMKGGKQ